MKPAASSAPDQQTVVRYQPLSDGEGLQLTGSQIVAWRAGRQIACAQLDADPELLPGLLRDARTDVCNLLDDVDFSYTEPRRHLIDVSVTRAARGQISGVLTVDGGDELPWRAAYSRHPEFLHADRLPQSALDRLHNQRDGRGWQIDLAAWLRRDEILTRRVALAIHAALRGIDAGVLPPYRSRVTNVFSATADDLWTANIPYVTPAP